MAVRRVMRPSESRTPEARIELGERRLRNVLTKHGIALARTLEQKISDAGPSHMRVDPHALTASRKRLQDSEEINSRSVNGADWYYLTQSSTDFVESRLQEQLGVYRHLHMSKVRKRTGQCLEIAVYRALKSQAHDYFGRFPDLDHPNSHGLVSKEEPPGYLGSREIPGHKKLDFLFKHTSAGWAGIEVKNIREWFYPDRQEIRDLLMKAIALNCVPVLIARRYSFVAFKVLSMCGVIFHQTFNQLYAEADSEIALKARHKDSLGYHDIRIGNSPDSRLTKFVHTNLPLVLPAARERFDKFKSLLEPFSNGTILYKEFAARARRRADGEDEDADWEEYEDDEY